MSCRIFVGNLPIDIREREIEDLFYKYGRIRDIDLKTPSRPPAFAFITFDDARDAEDAIRGRDGYNFDGMRLRVEMSKGDRARLGYGSDRGGGRDRDGGRSSSLLDRPRTGGRRTEFGVIVTGLPRSCSWQDLKDFMRKAGDVVYTDVDHNGDGVVEFSNRDDMERAVEKFDDEKFESNYGSAYIRVKLANKSSRRDKDDDDEDRDRKRRDDRDEDEDRDRDRKRRDDRDEDEDRDRDRKRRDDDDEDDRPRKHDDDDEDIKPAPRGVDDDDA